MPNKTVNYNLIKPIGTDYYDIGIHNQNMDTLDAELKKVSDQANQVGPLASYIYICTGKEDDKAIAKIINDFYGGTQTHYILGDANNDGRVSSLDLFAMQEHINGDITLTGEQFKAADVNLDGKIDQSDLDRLQKFIIQTAPLSLSQTLQIGVYGKLGLSKSPAGNAHIAVGGANAPIHNTPTVYLDMSNCMIDGQAIAAGKYLFSLSDNASLEIKGLNLDVQGNTTTLFNVTGNTGYLSLRDCMIYSSANVITSEKETRILENNQITSGANAVYVNSSTPENCKLYVGSNNYLCGNVCILAGAVSKIHVGANTLLKASDAGIRINSASGQGGKRCELTVDGAIFDRATYGINVQSAAPSLCINLTGCSFVGATGTTVEDVYQTSAANTVKWYIMGCKFVLDGIRVNGGSSRKAYDTASASIYFPQYANKFSLS